MNKRQRKKQDQKFYDNLPPEFAPIKQMIENTVSKYIYKTIAGKFGNSVKDEDIPTWEEIQAFNHDPKHSRRRKFYPRQK